MELKAERLGPVRMLPLSWKNHNIREALRKYLLEESYSFIDILKTQSLVKSVRNE